jgi:hypothetical protein
VHMCAPTMLHIRMQHSDQPQARDTAVCVSLAVKAVMRSPVDSCTNVRCTVIMLAVVPYWRRQDAAYVCIVRSVCADV